jgi:hypothetical protein
MAQEYKIGNEFFLRIIIDSTPAFIICEQNSELNVSAETITVLCKTTGSWTTILGGGLKSGSISFTGAYLQDPDSPNISAFELLALVGNVESVVWGSNQDGGDVVEVDAHITDVTITSNTNEAITFSATLTLSDEPTIGKFTT